MIMRAIVAILSLVSALYVGAVAVALAQAPPRPSDDEINARIMAIRAQREANADQAATCSAAASTQIAVLMKQVEDLKKVCGKACEPKEEKPKQ